MAVPQFSNRWLSDDAIGMMLQEADQRWLTVNDVPDPGLARAWLAAMTVFRFSEPLRRALYESLRVHRSELAWAIAASWMFNLAMMVEEDPETYPFCLSEREFDHYARTNFGDTVGNSEGIYHPPGFYAALVQDIVAAGIATGIAVAIAAALPEATAVSAGGLIGARITAGMATTGMGAVVGHLLPGGTWDAAKKNRLWSAYELDYKRRALS